MAKTFYLFYDIRDRADDEEIVPNTKNISAKEREQLAAKYSLDNGYSYKHVGYCKYIGTAHFKDIQDAYFILNHTSPALDSRVGECVIQKSFTQKELEKIINLFKHYSELTAKNGKNGRWNKQIANDWQEYLSTFDTAMHKAVENDILAYYLDEHVQYRFILKKLLEFIPKYKTLSASRLIPLLQKQNEAYVKWRLQNFAD